MNKQLSIVIVTYNSEKLIFDCLDSIYKYNDLKEALEVIIVDNCSNDSERMFIKIREAYSNDIILIHANSNAGYGAGNNLGVRHVSSKYFIVMNPDVRIIEPIFQKIVYSFDTNKNLGLLGVRFIDGSSHLHFKPEYNNLLNLLFANYLIKLHLFKIEEMFFSGSFLVFDKKVFIEAGAFDEKIFLFYEEADISNRILKNCKKTLLSDDIYVEHLVHTREINKYLLDIGCQSRSYYFNKYKANLNKYYKMSLITWRIKYVFAVILRDKYRAKHIIPWIKLCKDNRHT